MLCLDTNIAIDLLKGVDSLTRPKLDDAIESGRIVMVSTVVLFELWYGAWKSERREGNARKLTELTASSLRWIDFDAEDAEEAGNIRATLGRAGTPIGAYDVMIAAQARRRGAVLVTANVGEFSRVPGLQIENWMHADS
jgi:tRNA(fMet)-specific endonuclease VapC